MAGAGVAAAEDSEGSSPSSGSSTSSESSGSASSGSSGSASSGSTSGSQSSSAGNADESESSDDTVNSGEDADLDGAGSVDEDGVDEDAVDEDAVDEDAADEGGEDEDAVDEDAVDEDGEDAADDARMMEVHAHERFDLPARFRARRPEAFRHRFLMLVTQSVEIARVRQMYERADSKKELFGFIERLIQAAGRHRHRSRGVGLGKADECANSRDVAKRAWGFLHIRFELIDGGVELMMAVGDQAKQCVYRRLAPHGLGAMDEGSKAGEQPGVPSQEAGIHERGQKLGIVPRYLFQFVQLSNLLADREPKVPQGVQQGRHETLLGGVDLAVEEEQEVYVRVEAQVSASITANGYERHRGLGLGCRLAVQQLQDFVDSGRELGGRAGAAPSRLDLIPIRRSCRP